MKELLVIHFRPVNLYPPVINLVRFMSEQKNVKVILYTTSNRSAPQFSESVQVVIIPYSTIAIFRMVATLNFYIRVLIRLISTPTVPVLYYESLSSIPVWLYLTFFKQTNRKIAAHFHEYFSNMEYKRQSFWERTGRRLESSIFRKLNWISQTNMDRVKFFKKEFPEIPSVILHILPNYPPKSWLSDNFKSINAARPLKLVYVGSLTLEGTFIKELVDWLVMQGGKLNCTIFSQNAGQEVVSYLTDHSQGLVTFKGRIEYDQLPFVLPEYDVGLVLYNGASTNVIYSAPNKIFEYLACGLDVWFPTIIVSSRPYHQMGTYPKAIMIDFSKLETFDYLLAVRREGFSYKPSPFVMEMVYVELYDKIFQR